MKRTSGSPCALAALIAGIAWGFGCSQPSGKTLVDSLRNPNGEQVIAVAQVDLNTRNGLPSSKEVRSAKAIRRIVSPAQIKEFTNSLTNVREGTQFRNHPLATGNCVLRVETTNGTWFVFCELLESSGTRTCLVFVGPKDETNINRMNVYESDLLPGWLDKNQVQAK